jgi:hypothetical protein
VLSAEAAFEYRVDPTIAARIRREGAALVVNARQPSAVGRVGAWTRRGAFTALVGKPDVVILAYNLIDDSRLPQASTCDRGIYTDDVFWWVTRVSSGGEKDYEVTVINLAPVALWISVAVYARD